MTVHDFLARHVDAFNVRDHHAVDLAGTATDVLRRGPDGRWRYVIDNPFGARLGIGLPPVIIVCGTGAPHVTLLYRGR